jgi:hypothetical protein
MEEHSVSEFLHTFPLERSLIAITNTQQYPIWLKFKSHKTVYAKEMGLLWAITASPQDVSAHLSAAHHFRALRRH